MKLKILVNCELSYSKKKELRQELHIIALGQLTWKDLKQVSLDILEDKVANTTRNLQIVKSMLSQEPNWKRRQNAKLDALPTYQRRKWLAQKAELLFSLQMGSLLESTLPEEFSLVPITENTVDQLNRGDIVAFIIVKPDGDPRFVGRRITGFAGDIVQDVTGKRMKVPEGHFWAVGDNEAESFDSRGYGAVPLSNLRYLVYPLK
jgi:hypothetical protein